jgi:hypothetical protein
MVDNEGNAVGIDDTDCCGTSGLSTTLDDARADRTVPWRVELDAVVQASAPGDVRPVDQSKRERHSRAEGRRDESGRARTMPECRIFRIVVSS